MPADNRTTDDADRFDENRPSLDELMQHPEFPDVTDEDTVIDNGDTIVIEHGPDERTRVLVTTTGDGDAYIAGIVWYKPDMPDPTPADDVITVGDEVRIVHGPGRETRVPR